MMRFPSISAIFSEAGRVARRFPFVLLSAVVATIGGFAYLDRAPDDDVPMRLIQIGTLGLPLFVALGILGERWSWGRIRGVAISLAGVGSLILYYLFMDAWTEPVVARRYVQFSLALHLMVAILPYLRVREANGFWQFNRSLFVRFLISALFSCVLYAGLAIALLSLDRLLGVAVPDESYARLWMVIAFIFNTWYFLGGVPTDLRELDERSDYPRGLRIFSQYILVPLVTVYLAILTTYLVRILVTRVWPSGWIGYLVSSVAVVGILSLLLVEPIKNQPTHRWMKVYSRGFYIALFPSILMLLMAIGKRVEQYGITENRYFLIVLSLWLAGIAIYFVFSPRKTIKVIPASLLVVALLTAFGPWGAYSVSCRSQRARLQGILEQNALLVDGRLRPATTEVSADDRQEIGAIFAYLNETHGVDSYAGWLDFDRAAIDTVGRGEARHRGNRAREQAKALMHQLDLEYRAPWQSDQHQTHTFHAALGEHTVWIGDYDHALQSQNLVPTDFTIDERRYRLSFGDDQLAIRLQRLEADSALAAPDDVTLLDLDLRPMVEGVFAYRRSQVGYSLIPQDLMIADGEAGDARLRLSVASLSVLEKDGVMRMSSLSGVAFISIGD